MQFTRVAGLTPGRGPNGACDAILSSALCQIWNSCALLFSTKPVDSLEETTDHEIARMEQCMIACCKKSYTDDYNKPSRQLCTFLLANYKRRTFKAHDLSNVRAFSDTPGDPLTKTTATGYVAKKQTPDPVYQFDPETSKYVKIEDIDHDEGNYKKFNRKHVLYCNAEEGAANFCLGGTAEKPAWSNKTTETLRTLVIRYGMDPSAQRRIPLEKLRYLERELRQRILNGLRDGKWKTWDEALEDSIILNFINMEFRLMDPPPKQVTVPDRKPPYTPIKPPKATTRYEPYAAPPTPNKKEKKGKGKGKGADKHSASTASDGSRYLKKDPDSGKGFCVPWNKKEPCRCDNTFNSAACQFINKCNWATCLKRDTCQGAWWHRENPGKGVKQ